jgi:VWFA-related protein
MSLVGATLLSPYRVVPLVALVACLSSSGAVLAQQTENPPAPVGEGPVVRISVEVIQVDAVVTTKDGRPVADLGASDFEILEDGRRQEITLCTYVPLEGPAATGSGPAATAPRAGALRQADVRRTMAFLVDDLSLGWWGTLSARTALARFVDEQMQPGDVVAILQTGAGSGAFQQFTADKRLLHAAIDGLHFNLAGRGSISPLSIAGSEGNAAAPAARGGGAGAGDAAVAALRRRMDAFAADSNRQRQFHLALGTLGAVHQVLRGLQNMPGRKSLVFLSEGMSQRDRSGDRSDFYERLQRVTDLANRASVVIYAVDPGGLTTFGAGADASAPTTTLANRQSLEELRGSLSTLAEDTGGLLVTDSNDVSDSLGRVLRDQQGYYLIGYSPESSTFKPDRAGPKYHKIQLKVKRPNLRVRSRKGFYGVAMSGARAPVAEGHQQLANAVYSPFTAPDISVRLTSLFGGDPKGSSYVRSLLHMNIQGITFQEQANGSRKAELEIAAMTFGVDGFAVDRTARSDTISISSELFEQARRGGLVYSLDVPIKKPGAYQIRTVVRDVASGGLGSASQFVEVPDLGSGRLATSGLTLSAAGPTPNAAAEAAVDPDSTPAVRRFHRGASVSYALEIYNARTLAPSGGPQLLVRLSLFRDDRLVQSMPTLPFDGAGQPDPKRLALAGSFRLGSTMEPGRYVLEVAVQDTAAGRKAGPAAQWMDFDLVE